MSKIKLSVVIPSFKDPLLINTIDSILEGSQLGDSLEIIGVLDGFWPEFELRQDPRVRYVHVGRNRGMREGVNIGVSVAQGEFIMRTDSHCKFGPGFDRIITETCQPNWIVTATRYFLDPVKWEVMDIPPYIYEKLKIRQDNNGNDIKFEGQRWRTRDKRRRKLSIDETMAMQGSVWVMPKGWWEKVIVELQTEGYGPHSQDSHEMVFKTWQAGGKLMVNKNTWFAHVHYKFPRTHKMGTPENPIDYAASYSYSLSLWKDYYMKEIKPKWGV